MDIDRELAMALRARDPGPDFTAAVLAQLAGPAAQPLRPAAPAPRQLRRWRLPVSLAASVLVAVAGAWLVDSQLRQQRSAAAGEQLAMALAITSAQLNDVQQKISPNTALEDGI